MISTRNDGILFVNSILPRLLVHRLVCIPIKLKIFMKLMKVFFGSRFIIKNFGGLFVKQEIYANPDKTKYKKTYTGWSSKDASGKELLMSNLSGTLLAVQGFRSTICNVNESKYVINKIKAACSNEIKKLEEDFSQLAKSVGALIKKLRWKDFELFVDLIFRDMGCQRVGVVGGPQNHRHRVIFSCRSGEISCPS